MSERNNVQTNRENLQRHSKERQQSMRLYRAGWFDFSDDEYNEELNLFSKENPTPAEFKKYMPIGAVLLGTHGEPLSSLALMSGNDYYRLVLSSGWGIKSRDEAIIMLNSLLAGRHANLFSEAFGKIAVGSVDEDSQDDVDDYNISVEAIRNILMFDEKLVDDCKTLYGWDLERAGYLTRIFYNIGFLDRDQTLNYLKKTGACIKKTFTTWEEYITSMMLGRGFALGAHIEPFLVAAELLNNNRDIIDDNPISNF